MGIRRCGCVHSSARQLNYRCQTQRIAAKQYITSEWPLPVASNSSSSGYPIQPNSQQLSYRISATRATYQRHTCCSMARWACVGARLQIAQRGAVGGGQGWSAVVQLSVPRMHALCTQRAGCAAVPRIWHCLSRTLARPGPSHPLLPTCEPPRATAQLAHRLRLQTAPVRSLACSAG